MYVKHEINNIVLMSSATSSFTKCLKNAQGIQLELHSDVTRGSDWIRVVYPQAYQEKYSTVFF